MRDKLKKLAFSISEAIIVLAIMGMIAIVAYPIILHNNHHDDAHLTMAQKTAEYLEQASLEILINNCIYDDFTRIKYEGEYFSIEDDIAIEKFPKLMQSYMNDVDIKVNLNNIYFAKPIVDYNKTKLPITLKDTYYNYFWILDGVLVGFRMYDNCNATELYSNPPDHTGTYEVANVCGSIFFDINGFKTPNKIGNDQYILPIYKRGIKYITE